MIKKLALASLLAVAAAGAFAQNPHGLPPGIARKLAHCEDCGYVHSVHQEKREGEGGAVGIIGGAVVGGLLGHQVGGGTGKTLATVAGAAAGGFAGNEVQKKVTTKTVWVTKVTLKDGSAHSYEQEARPSWKAGSVVRVERGTLSMF